MSHAGRAGGDSSLPPSAGGLSRARRRLGFALSLVGLPALTAASVAVRDVVSLASLLLIYLLAVVVVAVVGGTVPAVLAAIASFLLANWFLTPPYYTFVVESADQAIELVVFVVIAVLVSVTVDVGARNRVRAERNRSEALLLSRLSATEVGGSTVDMLLEQIREIFGMTSVALVKQSDPKNLLASVGPEADDEPSLVVPTVHELAILTHGPELLGADFRLLEALAGTTARAYEEQRLSREAERAHQLAETDKVRSALLAAVSHDLRTPLSGIKLAASTLQQTDLTLPNAERAELLASIETAADRLTDLISSLLAMSRIQAGALSVHVSPVALDDVIPRAIRNAGKGSESITVNLPTGLPPVHADPVLLEGVISNLITNALHYSRHVEIDAATISSTSVDVEVVDHGPGVPETRWEEMFLPFQRLGDHTGEGVGLGLAIARGFVQAMGGTLTPHHTPGGGLTMTVRLPASP
jgi:two-component system, OmpR family, sensor histidine kinase KdpD